MNKYFSIYSDIIEKMNRESYGDSSYLPSEHQLCKEYNVSRETIRKALALLEENGYIQKKQGKGSFILKNKQIDLPISGLISFAELDQTKQFSHKTEIIKIEEMMIPTSLFLQNQAKSVLSTHIKRLRIINDTPIIVDEDYIIKDIVPVIKEDSIKKSLYQYLEDELNLDISYASKEITVQQAEPSDCRLLNIEEGEYVVVIVSNVFLSDTRMIQVTVSKHRVDKFKFTEFARRKKLKPISEPD